MQTQNNGWQYFLMEYITTCLDSIDSISTGSSTTRQANRRSQHIRDEPQEVRNKKLRSNGGTHVLQMIKHTRKHLSVNQLKRTHIPKPGREYQEVH